MKRSDMALRIIRDVIDKHLVNVAVPENLESFLAFDILDAVETAGMLPPLTFVETEEDGTFLNEWDSE